jgi:hypothetical protein
METRPLESGWKAYLRFVVMAGPALICWIFVAVFVFPKLTYMSRAAGTRVAKMDSLMATGKTVVENWIYFAAAVALLVAGFEFGTRWWKPRRARALVLIAFMINVAVIISLTGACILAAAAGPALIGR